jgi:hypothetical protein
MGTPSIAKLRQSSRVLPWLDLRSAARQLEATVQTRPLAPPVRAGARGTHYLPPKFPCFELTDRDALALA